MINLKKEHQASLNRKRYSYSFAARFFFFTMDLITGKKTTFSKIKLIEILASIPYRAWEIRQYNRLTRKYKNSGLVAKANMIKDWGREAQDNEYWHLLVINEKMKEEKLKDSWFLNPLMVYFLTSFYRCISSIMACFSISRAFLFNAEFEDHAEHVYAQFVADNPELDNQPIRSELVSGYGEFECWGDLFRRIGLDERDHRNTSFVFCGMPDQVVRYEGMPELPVL